MYSPWSYEILVLLWILNGYFLIKPGQARFVNCTANVTEQQICKVNENIPDKYLKHPPNHLEQSGLLEVTSKLTIESVPELVANDGTNNNQCIT